MGFGFLNKIILTNKEVLYTELKIKHLKVLYKCLIGDELDTKIVLTNLDNILKDVTNLEITELQKLSIIDYFCLLLDIRVVSIGSSVFVEIPDLTNTKIEINLVNFNNKLNNVKQKYLQFKDNIENFFIEYRLPTLHDIARINKQTSPDELYSIFIQRIQYKDLTIDLTHLSVNDIQQILNQLPAKVTSCLYKKIHNLLKDFNNINLLPNIPELNDRQLIFNFNINNLLLLIKILFGDELMSLYDNIFWLCKFTKFTPEYIENLTPGEYILYIKKIQAINNTDSSKNNSGLDMVNFDDNIG